MAFIDAEDLENDMLECDSVLSFAYQIISMNKRILQLEEENRELREYKVKYNNILNESIKYQNEMQGQVMELILNKGKFNEDR